MENRFPALVTGNGAPISYTEAGIPVPSVPTPDRFFNLLFIDEDAKTKDRQRQALGDNASILDVLLEEGEHREDPGPPPGEDHHVLRRDA